MVYINLELNTANNRYHPSRRVMQCDGSEDTLLHCMVTNATIWVAAVCVNCTTRTLHPLPVPTPSQNSSEFIFRETSTRYTLPSPSSPPQKATFLTPLISGVLGGLATLIGVTVLISGIFIVATRTKVCRAKRNSDKGTSPLYREHAHTQPSSSADPTDDILTEESVAYGVLELRIPVVQCAAYGIVPSGETGPAMVDADYEDIA